MTKSVLVFTPHSHPSHFDRDIPIVRALREQGYRADYAIPVEDFSERSHAQTNFPAAVLASEPFVSISAIPIHSHEEFERMLRGYSALIIGHTKESRFVQTAKRLGKYVIEHMDRGGLDLLNNRPDFFAVPGDWYKTVGARWHGLPPERVVVTGCVQYDRVQGEELKKTDRTVFCERYDLDPAKKIAVWLPEGPGTHNAWYKTLYQEICQTVLASGRYNLIIKGHPWDYSGYRREQTYGDTSRPSWEQLTPGVPVCRQEDAYLCFRHCDLGLTVTSAVYLDFALFRKPILFVDFQEAMLSEVVAAQARLPKKRFTGVGLRRLRLLPETLEIIRKIPNGQRTIYADPDLAGGAGLPFVGGECSREELPEILESDLTIEDPAAYDAIIREFCFQNDGRAAERIAQLVDQLPAKPGIEPASHYLRKVLKKLAPIGRLVAHG